MQHLTYAELEAGLDLIRLSPKDQGRLELIVARPESNARVVLETAEFSLVDGLVGDSWKARGSGRTSDGSAHPEMQVNVMNARAAALVAQSKERWQLAGDQLYVDLDLSGENLPVGTRLEIGSALLEVTEQPHTGCKKFVQRFGLDAMKFVNSTTGRSLNLRGINTKVVQAGSIRTGDEVVVHRPALPRNA